MQVPLSLNQEQLEPAGYLQCTSSHNESRWITTTEHTAALPSASELAPLESQLTSKEPPGLSYTTTQERHSTTRLSVSPFELRSRAKLPDRSDSKLREPRLLASNTNSLIFDLADLRV